MLTWELLAGENVSKGKALTLADCQSDHGLLMPEVVVARTRQRISQPSFNLSAGTTAHAFVPEAYEVADEPAQITPDPCSATVGSCSISTLRTDLRFSGSVTFAYSQGVKVAAVHDAVPRTAGSIPSPSIDGFFRSTLVDCQSDHGPATPEVVSPRTRHRTSQPSLNLPPGICTHAFEPESYAFDPLPAQICPVP
ncbi:hypothetical protein ACTWPT_09780 [Nonomuraea sp. 3N208]|uniref:hypothetical protein n=1 Tax=Nonomuraea sp. 3N208 TaxID=3457421 RepID=UPI003FCE3C49